jgi:hypothetical protein
MPTSEKDKETKAAPAVDSEKGSDVDSVNDSVSEASATEKEADVDSATKAERANVKAKAQTGIADIMKDSSAVLSFTDLGRHLEGLTPKESAQVLRMMLDQGNDATTAASETRAATEAEPEEPFALTPSARTERSPLNFAKPDELKLYNRNIKPLDTLYDGKTINRTIFLQQIENRSQTANFYKLLHVELFNNNDGPQSLYIINHWGSLTQTDVVDYAKSFTGSETRLAQDDSMLGQCILSSITQACFANLILKSSIYTLYDMGIPVKSGIIMLKIIIDLGQTTTRASSAQVLFEIAKAPAKMIELRGSIVTFNKWFNNHLITLRAHGEVTNDPSVMVHLFAGLCASPCPRFVDHIEGIREDWEAHDPKVTTTYLTDKAEAKYHVLDGRGEYNRPPANEEELVALRSVVKTHGKNLKTLAKEAKERRAPRGTGNNPGNTTTRTARDLANAWKKIPSPDGVATKNKNGKKYHWCPAHSAWTLHTPSECEGVNTNSGGAATGSTTSTTETEGTGGQMRLASALEAMIEEQSDDSQAEEE